MMIINNENIINDGGGGSEEHEHINTVLFLYISSCCYINSVLLA
jgi:hypothetical protein